MKIKALAELPAKKANSQTLMNQQLAGAIGFIATVPWGLDFLRAAAQLLCISQARWQSFCKPLDLGNTLMTAV
ncbi:MAG: hypothetical protein U1E71_14180 [Ramlibacter sp.]